MRINSHLSFIRHHMRTVRGEFIEIITQDHYQLVTTPPSVFGLIDGEAYMGAASIYRSAIESLVRLTRVDDAKNTNQGVQRPQWSIPESVRSGQIVFDIFP